MIFMSLLTSRAMFDVNQSRCCTMTNSESASALFVAFLNSEQLYHMV
jgi:hypothetical protein